MLHQVHNSAFDQTDRESENSVDCSNITAERGKVLVAEALVRNLVVLRGVSMVGRYELVAHTLDLLL